MRWCAEIVREKAISNTDGLTCSVHLVYCVGLNSVIKTDVSTVQNLTSISPFPIKPVKWIDE